MDMVNGGVCIHVVMPIEALINNVMIIMYKMVMDVINFVRYKNITIVHTHH